MQENDKQTIDFGDLGTLTIIKTPEIDYDNDYEIEAFAI
jgi:hypothetical protein